MDIETKKIRARFHAKLRREETPNPRAASIALLKHLPHSVFQDRIVGGYWPLKGEIDVRPLLFALSDMGIKTALPCTPRKGKPLVFRSWTLEQSLKAGPFGTQEPSASAPIVTPTLLLVPLLAFTKRGERLGYGGGYYDRTLEELQKGADEGTFKSVFACGVAFDIQRTDSLPVGAHDWPLDAILTETGYTEFKRLT